MAALYALMPDRRDTLIGKTTLRKASEPTATTTDETPFRHKYSFIDHMKSFSSSIHFFLVTMIHSL